ncbi:rRNA-processing protein sof1 [Ceratobasidium sp. 414]|nr:rRNA-processing protein sof1 [Ceratobasidium sp. 414]
MHLPQRKGDATPITRNLNPLAHPFARARERTRALNAAKIERMFSKPFVASLEGHVDGVYTLATKAGELGTVTSGSGDGEIIIHDLAEQRHLLKFPGAHKGTVSAITYAEGPRLLSCGVDRTVKLWDTTLPAHGGGEQPTRAPLNVFPGKVAFKSTPVSNLTFPTSNETITALRFNLSESSVLATTGTDRTMTLYDIRTGKAERRLVMQMRANALSWSPTFPTTLLLASEDHNLYTFDVRSLVSPTQIYKGHVAAVMSCGWSPTGHEFVSGGWDRSVRIWKEGQGSGSAAYTGKRMQRVFATAFTQDARFVVSGSDDGNVRLWKAKAAEKLGVVDGRERAAKEYRDRLRERWRADKEVGRIERQQRLPMGIKKASELKRTMLSARAVKEERRRKHTRAGASKPKAERKKVVVVEQT